MTIEEMDHAYSNLKTEYFDIQDKLTTARQLIDDYEKDIVKLKKELEIAVAALKVYAETFIRNGTNRVILENGYVLEYNPEIAKKAFNEIEELEK